jgi:NDP-sugar pyrophosphorylase family protein
LIEAVLADGSSQGVELTYVREEEPLGTAGALRLIDDIDRTFIMMNGDVLTTLDFRDLARHHEEQGNVVTIATHERAIQVDYGVLHLGTNGNSNRVRRYVEKPQMTSTVSMGIYMLEPEALSYIPEDGYFDFPDLVHALLRAKQDVGVYRSDDMWFDIGRPDDYQKAVAAWGSADESVVEAVVRSIQRVKPRPPTRT